MWAGIQNDGDALQTWPERQLRMPRHDETELLTFPASRDAGAQHACGASGAPGVAAFHAETSIGGERVVESQHVNVQHPPHQEQGYDCAGNMDDPVACRFRAAKIKHAA